MSGHVRSIVRDLSTDGRGWILLAVAIGWFFSLGSRMVYPVVLPQITVEFHIDYGIAGIVLSVLWLAYALMNIPGGLLADRLGERFVLVAAMATACVGIVLIVTAPSFAVFLLATVVFGVGCGLFGTTGTTILSDVYAARDTTAIGLTQAAGSIGMIVLPAAAGVVIVMFGWRLGIGYILPGFLLVAIGLWVMIPPRTSDPVGMTGDAWQETARRVANALVDRTLILIVVALSCIGFVFQGLTGFLPVYLIDSKGFAQWEASLVFGLLFAGMIAGKVASGPVADRYGKRTALIGFAGTGAPTIVFLPLIDDVLLIVGLVVVAGLMLGITPVAMAYVIQFAPDDIQGSVFGTVRTVFIGVGVLAPPVIGLLADRGRFDFGIFLLGGVAVLSIFVVVLLPSSVE